MIAPDSVASGILDGRGGGADRGPVRHNRGGRKRHAHTRCRTGGLGQRGLPRHPGGHRAINAVIVADPTVFELVMVAVYVPFLLSVTAPIFSALSLEENVTVSPETGLGRRSQSRSRC